MRSFHIWRLRYPLHCKCMLLLFLLGISVLIISILNKSDMPTTASQYLRQPYINSKHGRFPLDHEEQLRRNSTLKIASVTKAPEIAEIIVNRTRDIYNRCRLFQNKFPRLSANTTKKTKSYYEEAVEITEQLKYGLRTCTVPKQGSTFWKKVFIEIVGGFMSGSIPYGPSLGFYPLEKVENRKQLKSLPSFTVVRNPWRRLVSIYQQKLEPWGDWQMSRNKSIVEYCHKILQSGIPQTFKEFLDCVLHTAKSDKPNSHWKPASETCAVCTNHYDYIISAENMSPEGAYVLKSVGMENSTEFLEQVRAASIRKVESRSNKPLYSAYYRDIPSETIERLKDYYSADIALFGYPDSPFEEEQFSS